MLDSAVDREALKNIAIENDAGRHAVVEGFHGLEKGGWTANSLQDTIEASAAHRVRGLCQIQEGPINFYTADVT